MIAEGPKRFIVLGQFDALLLELGNCEKVCGFAGTRSLKDLLNPGDGIVSAFVFTRVMRFVVIDRDGLNAASSTLDFGRAGKDDRETDEQRHTSENFDSHHLVFEFLYDLSLVKRM